MLNYIYGKIIYIAKTFLIIDNNGIGYKLKIFNEENFSNGEFSRVYVHCVQKMDNRNYLTEDWFGFVNTTEKQLFIDLLSVNGIGTVIASQVIRNGYLKVIQDIASGNLEAIQHYKSINEKLASAIVTNLMDKYQKYKTTEVTKQTQIVSDLIMALQELGYSHKDIELALEKCSTSDNLENMIKESMQIISTLHSHA